MFKLKFNILISFLLILLLACSADQAPIKNQDPNFKYIFMEQSDAYHGYIHKMSLKIPKEKFQGDRRVLFVDFDLAEIITKDKFDKLPTKPKSQKLRISISRLYKGKRSFNKTSKHKIATGKNEFGLTHQKFAKCLNVPFPKNTLGEGKMIGDCYTYRAHDFYYSYELDNGYYLDFTCGHRCIVETGLHNFSMNFGFDKAYLPYWSEIYQFVDQTSQSYVMEHSKTLYVEDK